MNGQGSVDAGSLGRRARELEEREAVATVLETPGVRIIVGSRISDDGSAANFIEVASYLDGGLHATYDDMMVERQRLDRALKDLGCSSYDDDLDRIWEVATTDEDLAIVLDRVRKAVTSALQPDLPDPFSQ